VRKAQGTKRNNYHLCSVTINRQISNMHALQYQIGEVQGHGRAGLEEADGRTDGIRFIGFIDK
jgi:hypothetical protein